MSFQSNYGPMPAHLGSRDREAQLRLESLLQQDEEPPYVVIERGPWKASGDGRQIASDDFTHDVILCVTGDFGSDSDRKAYAEEIARRLNQATPNPKD